MLMSVLKAFTNVTRIVTTILAPTVAAVTLDTDCMLMDLVVMVNDLAMCVYGFC